MDLYQFFWPGRLNPYVRAIIFFLFLLITVLQIYCSLLMEDQLDRTPLRHIEA